MKSRQNINESRMQILFQISQVVQERQPDSTRHWDWWRRVVQWVFTRNQSSILLGWDIWLELKDCCVNCQYLSPTQRNRGSRIQNHYQTNQWWRWLMSMRWFGEFHLIVDKHKFTYMFSLQSKPSESPPAPPHPFKHLFPPGLMWPTAALLSYPQLSLQIPHIEGINMIFDVMEQCHMVSVI